MSNHSSNNHSKRKRSGTTSTFHGVSWRADTNRWQVSIDKGEVRIRRSFSTEIDAAKFCIINIIVIIYPLIIIYKFGVLAFTFRFRFFFGGLSSPIGPPASLASLGGPPAGGDVRHIGRTELLIATAAAAAAAGAVGIGGGVVAVRLSGAAAAAAAAADAVARAPSGSSSAAAAAGAAGAVAAAAAVLVAGTSRSSWLFLTTSCVSK